MTLLFRTFYSRILSLITRAGRNTLYAAIRLAAEEEIDSFEVLISRLDTLSDEEFVCRVFADFDFSAEELTLNSPLEHIVKKITSIRDKDEAENFASLTRHPNNYKNRLIETLNLFYQLYLKDQEDTLHMILSRTAEEHEKLLLRDRNQFFKDFFQSDYSNLFKKAEGIDIYISEYLEYDFLYFKGSRPVIVYGRYNSARKKAKRRNALDFFKALSDERRIEIIKLLKKRTWYSNELAGHFSLTPATMSYHINRLTILGILEYKTGEQNKLYYKINKDILKKCFRDAYSEITGDDPKSL